MTKYLVLFILALGVCAQAAELPRMVITREESFVTGVIPGLEEVYEDLGFTKGGNPRLFLRDLTGDQNDDILMEGKEELCGMGGCLYALVDGGSRRVIGYFLAEALLIEKKKKGDSLPDIKSYSDLGSGKGVMIRYSHSRGLYREISRVEIPTTEFQRLVEEVGVAKSHHIAKGR